MLDTVLVKLLIGGLAAIVPHDAGDLTVLFPEPRVTGVEIPDHTPVLVFLADNAPGGDCSAISIGEFGFARPSRLPGSSDEALCYLDLTGYQISIRGGGVDPEFDHSFLAPLHKPAKRSALSSGRSSLLSRARIQYARVSACGPIGQTTIDRKDSFGYWTMRAFDSSTTGSANVLASSLEIETEMLPNDEGKICFEVTTLDRALIPPSLCFENLVSTPPNFLLTSVMTSPSGGGDPTRDQHFYAHYELAVSKGPLASRKIPYRLTWTDNGVRICKSPFYYECFTSLDSMSFDTFNDDLWSLAYRSVGDLCRARAAGPPICPKGIFAQVPPPIDE